jgi:WXG100 family type VII secretion target
MGAPISDFKVSTADVESLSTYVGRTVDDIEAQMARLRTFVVNTEEYWQGMDQAAFIELMQQFDTNAKALNTSLDGIRNGLQSNATNYSTTGATNRQTLASTHSALPPANL